MKILIQKVTSASVEVDSKVAGSIGSGLLLYVGITHTDTEATVAGAVKKILEARLFPSPDKSTHFDSSVIDVDQDILVVSQFTLYGSLKKGRRPSFDEAMPPEAARDIYELFLDKLSAVFSKPIQTGIFGAHMLVQSTNDGPLTFIIEL